MAIASKNANWDARVAGECVRDGGNEMPRWVLCPLIVRGPSRVPLCCVYPDMSQSTGSPDWELRVSVTNRLLTDFLLSKVMPYSKVLHYVTPQ